MFIKSSVGKVQLIICRRGSLCIIGKKKKVIRQKIFKYKFYLTGLGYKIFFFRKKLFILVGFSHYVTMRVPFSIKIIVLKKKMFMFSSRQFVLSNFINNIKACRRVNVFKHKGLFRWRQFKKIIKIKAGKKKQFM